MSKNNEVSKILIIGLWVGQILLAGMFGMAGTMKTFTPIDELVKKLPDMAMFSEPMVRFIGISELAGVVGLFLPAFIKFLPGFLTPLASFGLMLIMILAAGIHITRGEISALPIVAVLAMVSLFVAWGRFFKAPFQKQA